jgi:hypothetical protein
MAASDGLEECWRLAEDSGDFKIKFMNPRIFKVIHLDKSARHLLGSH